MIQAILKELELRSSECKNQAIETIYFGGGTPSLLSVRELHRIIAVIYKNYKTKRLPEITLEANPDDLSKNQIVALSKSSINRLSIGIQSFHDADLKLLNRTHNANQAKACLAEATKHFDNISIDLIYGIPGTTNTQWLDNINIALSYDTPHISSYALTVEPNTALANFIQKGIISNVDDEKAHQQFYILKERLEDKGFIHYELSNFSKEGFFSKNNSAYWQGKTYLGIGPSAHSYNGTERSWNIRSNTKYIKAIQNGKLPIEIETLSQIDRYNEYIMTGLRTMWGVSLIKVENEFGLTYKNYLIKQANIFINQHLLYLDNEHLHVTKNGQFLSDGIASDLFILNILPKSNGNKK